MNHGLVFYSIFLITIATIVFSLGNYKTINATRSIDFNSNNSTHTYTKHDSRMNDHNSDQCRHCDTNQDYNNNNNNNKDKNIKNDNNNNNNDESKNVPLKLPFNSQVGDQSETFKDYSSAIPFP